MRLFGSIVLLFCLSGCAYYPDLYSVDTTKLRAKVCTEAELFPEYGTEQVQENCPGFKETRALSAYSRASTETRTAWESYEEAGDGGAPVLTSRITVDELVEPETPEAFAKRVGSPGELERAIVQASWLQDQYEAYYQDTSKINDILQLPILVAAGASGLVLLDGTDNQSDRVAEIGVLAATFAAGRSALTTADMPVYYIKGHGALNCAIASGLRFSTEDAEEGRKRFGSIVKRHAELIATLEATFAIVPDVAGDATSKALLSTARTLANTTLNAARTARVNALKEMSAFDGSTLAFHLEISEISVAVASKGQVRTNADLDTYWRV